MQELPEQAWRPEILPGPHEDFPARPPGWPLHVACLLTALLILWEASHPYYWLPYSAGFLLAGLLAAYWFLRLAAHWWVGGWNRRRFLVAPVGGLAVLGLLWFDAPARARWSLSQDAFLYHVRTAPALPEGETHLRVGGRQLVGLYRIRAIHRTEAGVLFRATFDCGWTGDGGFAWLPDGPPTEPISSPLWLAGTTYDHFDGPWYLTCESWD